MGSGTGQHAIFIAEARPDLSWQPSELTENLAQLRPRIQQCGLDNIRPPVALDVNERPWLSEGGRRDAIDSLFSANTLHIMSAASVENFLRGIGDELPSLRRLCIYGPFRYAGDFTTESNARFDDWLKSQNARSGIRDFEWVNELAAEGGFTLLEDRAMPANNQLLIWARDPED